MSMQTGTPITLGVLTTDSIEQAIERAGTKHGNMGSRERSVGWSTCVHLSARR